LKIARFVLCLGLFGALTLAHGFPAAKTSNTAAQQPADSGGKIYTHQEGGITFDLPSGWKAEAEGDLLSVSSPGESVGLFFWVTKEADFDAALKALDDELSKVVKNVKTSGEPKTDTHNGMPHASLTGTGEVEGKQVSWSVDLLQAKKPVIVLTFASGADFEKHAADYGKLVKSIKKVE
jgi:hypothetical protein